MEKRPDARVICLKMSKLNTFEKQILEKLFQMSSGYVLDFSDRTFSEFFRDEIGVNIYSKKYNYLSGSKANRLRAFWLLSSDKEISFTILKLIEYIEHKILLGDFNEESYPGKLIEEAKKIASRLIDNNKQKQIKTVTVKANIVNNQINICLNNKVFAHVQGLLNDGYYFNAVEESYKIVREKLKSVTGKEKAHEAFNSDNYKKIFGHCAKDEAEADFFEGVKFLHMAIQNLRNEKAHTPAKNIDKNLAIHYIVLASLAYDLIDRKV